MSETQQIKVFKLVTKAKGFKALGAAFSTLVDEATIHLTPEGISVALMDISHKEMFHFLWGKEKFSEYDVKEKIELTFHVNTFIAIFRRFNNDDNVIMESTSKNTVIFKQVRTQKEFDCNLIVSPQPLAPNLNISYNGEFILELTKLEEMISDSEVFGAEEAWFESENGKLIYRGIGEYAGQAKGILLEQYQEEISNTAYRFEYLKPFLTSMKPFIDEQIKVQIGKQRPIHLTLNLGDDIGVMEYHLGEFSK